DVHPDSFTGAVLLKGKDAASARVVSTSRRVELPELEKWVARHTGEQDVLVLEASGNAFAVAERLRVLQRQVVILDSHRAGKVGKAYCANDRVDAIKIARIYLTALSPVVWQPDAKTRERREVFSAYQAVVKEATRLCGIMLITLYGLSASIGDIKRFSNSRKLSAYFGLNPSVEQTGNWEGEGALKRHGRGALRALLVQSAKKLLRVNNPLQKWGLAVATRRGRNKAAVALARKLCVAVW